MMRDFVRTMRWAFVLLAIYVAFVPWWAGYGWAWTLVACAALSFVSSLTAVWGFCLKLDDWTPSL